ncbi:MAG: YggT family protein [Blastocatellia bacterium]|nr:YggT family protein [Blastocatellia bacterium]MCS7157610.1 YggT family protein [Blastocatellia bacterium]MCX7751875.1 YggT family protein [Blastocatellia bacterium]MDW8166981.1 YggT family protein [Acidobacteriota bacterium]MDW8257085.1 YggT family protein [Acidobacteriota bacterium]
MNVVGFVFEAIRGFLWVVFALAVGLVVARMVVDGLRLNPFGWFPYVIRRWSEPLLMPLRRNPLAFTSRYDLAPILFLILAILVLAFGLHFVSDVHRAVIGFWIAARFFAQGELGPGARHLIGHVLLLALSVAMICVIFGVVFSWIGVYRGRLVRFIWWGFERITTPLRRVVPPLGMFDLTPLAAYFILLILSWIVQVTFFG